MRSSPPHKVALLTVLIPLAAACHSDTAVGDGSMDGTGSTTSGTSTSGSSGESTTAETDPCDATHEGDLRIDETTDLTTLEHVRTVNGDLRISGVETVDLSFLACLDEVTGDVGISQNSTLETLNGIQRLTAIRPGDMAGEGTGTLRIVSNPKLRTLGGLDGLVSVQGILISDNAALGSIGLAGLERVENGIVLGGCSSSGTGVPAVGTGGNPMLPAIDGLDSLQFTAGLFIYGQAHLASLSRLRELAESGTDFGNRLEVGVNPELPSTEIDSFVAAAGIATVIACQNKDDAELCSCPSD